MPQITTQAQIVNQETIKTDQAVESIALFDSSGVPVGPVSAASKTAISGLVVSSVADQPAASGANPTKAEYDALVTAYNSTKALVNSIILALKA